eukprot:16435228-Heterocapsa_arctica.AAC.1
MKKLLPLVKENRIPKKVIEYAYSSKCMKDRGGPNLKNLGLYIAEMKCVSIVVWDITGMNQILRIDAGINQEGILDLESSNEVIRVRGSIHTVLVGDHLQMVSNPNLQRRAQMLGRLDTSTDEIEFTTTNSDSYAEYEDDRLMNNQAPIIV